MARAVDFCKYSLQLLLLFYSVQFVLTNRNYSDFSLHTGEGASDILVKQAYAYFSYRQVNSYKGFKKKRKHR